MKKIIIAVLGLGLLFGGASVFASTSWNDASNDCQTISIANAETSSGWGDPCWPGTSVSASNGDIVNIRVYYHNTGNSTATNTRVYLSHSGGTSNHHSFSGQITSSQGNISFGPVYANLSSAQNLTFDSVHWYTNNTQATLTSLLNGQDGSEVLNGGLSIGSIAPGWSTQGSVVIGFKVGGGNNNNSNCYISNFEVDGSSSTTISQGDSVGLDWSTNNCSSVHVSGPNFSSSNASGSATLYPNNSGTYTISAYGGNNGTQTRSVYVNVNNNNNNNSHCSISYFNASPTSVDSGGSSTLSWSMSNCTSASISNIGSVNSYGYGSKIVYPSYTTNYVLTAYGNNGSDSDSVQVSVRNYYVDPTPVYTNCAVTTAATNISTSSASLNGFVTGSATAYFEYGTTVNMGSITTTRSVSNGYINETLTGLTPGGIYYYRLVSNCQNGGLSRGAIQVFQTLGGQGDVEPVVTRTIIRQGTTIVGTQSPIMLKIEDKYQNIRVGDIIDYTVTYKNISNKKLTHAMVQVILPKGVSFVNSSRGTFLEGTNTLSVPLDDLNPADNGVVYLQGRVDSIENNYSQIVTTALLIYTNTNTAQENAMAYVLNNPINAGGFSLGANAFFTGIFGMSLLGWLLLILIILIIILLTRRYFPRRSAH